MSLFTEQLDPIMDPFTSFSTRERLLRSTPSYTFDAPDDWNDNLLIYRPEAIIQLLAHGLPVVDEWGRPVIEKTVVGSVLKTDGDVVRLGNLIDSFVALGGPLAIGEGPRDLSRQVPLEITGPDLLSTVDDPVKKVLLRTSPDPRVYIATYRKLLLESGFSVDSVRSVFD